jgi:hypothetical protein
MSWKTTYFYVEMLSGGKFLDGKHNPSILYKNLNLIAGPRFQSRPLCSISPIDVSQKAPAIPMSIESPS